MSIDVTQGRQPNSAGTPAAESSTAPFAVLNLATPAEWAVLVTALERHLIFLDAVMDRLAAAGGGGRAEHIVDVEAELAAGVLVQLARFGVPASEQRPGSQCTTTAEQRWKEAHHE